MIIRRRHRWWHQHRQHWTEWDMRTHQLATWTRVSTIHSLHLYVIANILTWLGINNQYSLPKFRSLCCFCQIVSTQRTWNALNFQLQFCSQNYLSDDIFDFHCMFQVFFFSCLSSTNLLIEIMMRAMTYTNNLSKFSYGSSKLNMNNIFLSFILLLLGLQSAVSALSLNPPIDRKPLSPVHPVTTSYYDNKYINWTIIVFVNLHVLSLKPNDVSIKSNFIFKIEKIHCILN